MLTPLTSLDEEAVIELLAAEYGSSAEALGFAPLGEDSWCYRAGDLWVSVRRDLRGHEPAAYAAATRMREGGARFVLAPLRGSSGGVVHTVGGLPVVVFPYVACSSLDAGASNAERRQALALLAELHRLAVAEELGTEPFDLPFDDELELVEAIARGEHQPGGGPFAEPLGRLLRTHRERVLEWRVEFEELAARCRRQGFAPRLTHGEPLASNFLRTGDGLMLADWGELMIGPAERDWSHVERTLGATPPSDPDLRRLYDLRWRLSELGEYTTVLAAPHAGGADDAAMWERLTRYLPVAVAGGGEAVAR